MFVGPIHLMVGQRLRSRSKATKDKQITSVWATNAGIAVGLALAIWAIGWKATLLVYGLPIYLAAMAGIWLFYVQHQFEDAYWESHEQVGLRHGLPPRELAPQAARRCFNGSPAASACTTFTIRRHAFRTTASSAATTTMCCFSRPRR